MGFNEKGPPEGGPVTSRSWENLAVAADTPVRVAGAGLHPMRDGRACHCTDGSADDRARRTGHSADTGADRRAPDAFFRGGAGCGHEAEKGDESELLHEKPPEKADDGTGDARSVRNSAGLRVTRMVNRGSGK